MNGTRRRAILFGASLILQRLRVELAGVPRLDALVLDHPLEAPQEEPRALQPAETIFDLGAVPPDFSLAMLKHTNFLIIGIDPETHQALVWSGRQAANHSDVTTLYTGKFARNCGGKINRFASSCSFGGMVAKCMCRQ